MITPEAREALAERKAAAHFKADLRKVLMDVVYGPPLEKLQLQLDDLLAENLRYTGIGWGVSFRGRLFRHSMYLTATLPLVVPRPHKNVAPYMQAWLTKMVALEQEQILSGGAVTAVLNSVGTHDYLKVFPECLHSTLLEFMGANPPQPKAARPLTPEQLADLQTQQGPYIALLQQRMLWHLISS